MTFNEKEYMKKYLKEYNARPEVKERKKELRNKWRREHPGSRKEEYTRSNTRRLKFKNKMIHVKDNPRTGFCSLCNYTGVTHIHHIVYHDDDPLKDTIELCPSCHRKESVDCNNR